MINVPRQPWGAKAFCRGANPEIFVDALCEETARAYCQRCPVVAACLSWALQLPEIETTGIWGNTNDAERRALRRGGQRASCPGCQSAAIFNDGISQICVGCGLSWRA